MAEVKKEYMVKYLVVNSMGELIKTCQRFKICACATLHGTKKADMLNIKGSDKYKTSYIHYNWQRWATYLDDLGMDTKQGMLPSNLAKQISSTSEQYSDCPDFPEFTASSQ
eukprot:11206306-Lingulodinium_polyedra.AAC.1